MTSTHDSIRAIIWQHNYLKLLDQRELPTTVKFNHYYTASSVAEAIRHMVVRGAPAIGITAAYAIVLSVNQHYTNCPSDWCDAVRIDCETLAAARPTAVNLCWAIDYMQHHINIVQQQPNKNPFLYLLEIATQLHDEDIQANYTMGRLGAKLIQARASVITHCNTGSLATGGYGTALGVIRQAYVDGNIDTVYADETRPWLQGSRLTAWELQQDNIGYQIITDNAASYLMQQGKISWAIVGSDRIAANGDVANKIGTYQLAISARYHGVKFMVVAPCSTVDMSKQSGDEIPIEQRDEQEILTIQGKQIAATGSTAYNPAFDITPAELIDALVTEKAVVRSPNKERMLAMMNSAEKVKA